MPELAKKTSQLDQGAVNTYTLFTQNDILITLDLPSILKLGLDRSEVYPKDTNAVAAPMFKNNSPYIVKSATFTIKLGDINGQSGKIATAKWQNPGTLDEQESMSFTCENVSPHQEIQCGPDNPGYTKIRWGSTMISGMTKENLNQSLTLVSLTLGPVVPENIPPSGPNISVAPNN
ncbi:hypothetical protein [Pseudomonas chlororaphis]|uniref:hypothetical protein n=1 Tax=Pseudomonas chlororaphis TaxID=587753 RepID=UPI0012D2CAAD|nr:hypothetical protein [Pseudomonas chlororaphis]